MSTTWGRHNRYTIEEARQRFLSHVKVDPDTHCHIWTGSKNGGGRYGSLGLMGKHWLAHRAAWFLFKGIDPKNSCVLHLCDNGICVNPEHLFIGTQLDNVRDAEAKGRARHPRAEEHGRAKLNWNDVNRIREKHRNGVPIRRIALEYPFVSEFAVSCVVKHITWITK